MSCAVIDLKCVEAALAARRIAAYQNRCRAGSGCRWAAMSAHWRTNDCDRRRRVPWRFAFTSMLVPLDSGYLNRVVEQVRLREGLDAVRRTWGRGYRAMQSDTASAVVR